MVRSREHMVATKTLNKFEKRDLILRLLKEGKIYREICHIAHVSPRDIKPIAKEIRDFV